MASKGNTWCKKLDIKRKAQVNRALHGAYEPHSENAEKRDRRDGAPLRIEPSQRPCAAGRVVIDAMVTVFDGVVAKGETRKPRIVHRQRGPGRGGRIAPVVWEAPPAGGVWELV